MIIVDAHEDIAYNALVGARDFRTSVADKRAADGGDSGQGREGLATVGLPDLLAGDVAVVFSTIYVSPRSSAFGGDQRIGYSTPQEAESMARAQMDYYRRLADEDPRVKLIVSRSDLDAHLAHWQSSSLDKRSVGLVTLMEGADPIVKPDDIKRWFDAGVRVLGLSWSQTRYAGGTRAPGGLTDDGRKLLKLMNDLPIIWDISHLAEESFWQGIDIFHGRVIASHSNCRAFVPTDRQLTDDMIRKLIEREAVIGIVLYNRFLNPDWEPEKGKQAVTLREDALKHIDHICQIAGSARHVGFGSDFDGGFGMQSIPAEMDSVRDFGKLGDALKDAGYKQADIDGILGGNWLRVLKESLP
ncbi:MAG: membrane dipeptidase [Chloroflexi bacterium]|nr:membrane dipeptidase [Chloroflexota bacterium]